MRQLVLCLSIVTAACGADDAGAPDASAPPRDTHVPLDAGAPCVAWDVRRTCVLSAPSATVRGDTPLGPLELPYAWAQAIDACGTIIHLGTRDTPPGSLPLGVVPLGAAGDDWHATNVGFCIDGLRHEVEAEIRVTHDDGPGDTDDDRPGENDLCRCPTTGCECDPGTGLPCPDVFPRHVLLELRTTAPGWSVAGEIDAVYCHALHGHCF